jgi:hypothetical protein
MSMQRRNLPRYKPAGLIAAAICNCTAIPAHADDVTYIIDPARSALIASGTFSGQTLQTNQFGSSDDPVIHDGFTAAYTGTITVSRNLLTGAVQITSAVITAQDNPYFSSSPPSPPVPSNYSFFISPFGGSSNDNPSPLFEANVRDFSFSLVSPQIASPTSFDVSQLSATITSGRVDYATVYGFGLNEIENDSSAPIAGNLPIASATTSLADPTGTLSIPIDTDLDVQLYGSPLALHLSGTIVATIAPEPATAALLIPAALLVRRTRARKSRI